MAAARRARHSPRAGCSLEEGLQLASVRPSAESRAEPHPAQKRPSWSSRAQLLCAPFAARLAKTCMQTEMSPACCRPVSLHLLPDQAYSPETSRSSTLSKCLSDFHPLPDPTASAFTSGLSTTRPLVGTGVNFSYPGTVAGPRLNISNFAFQLHFTGPLPSPIAPQYAPIFLLFHVGVPGGAQRVNTAQRSVARHLHVIH